MPPPSPPPSPDPTDDYDRPSKTRLKQAMHELQSLGEALTTLPRSRVDALGLPESLRDALAEYERTRSHEGRRRQMQYIGKLMRRVDPEPIREAVAAAQLGQARDALALHQAERWRDDLVGDDAALTRWMQAHPSSDLQQLRSLIRAARKDAAVPSPPGVAPRKGRAWRELFQFLKPWLGSAGAAGPLHDEPEAGADDDE